MLLLPIIIWWAKSPMRFSVGRSRQLICLLSLWAITAAALPTTRNVVAGDPMMSPQGKGEQKSSKMIREGTGVPPTQGRVVLLGRRWAFVPDHESLLHRQMAGKSPQDVFGSNRARLSQPIRIVSQAKLTGAKVTEQSGRDRVSTPMTLGVNRLIGPITLVSSHTLVSETGQNGGSGTRFVGSGTKSMSSEHGQPMTSHHHHELKLAENLMLQRIVRAIRSDVSDDSWILSGTINEFFGENRMVITSAQRGNVE